MKELELYINDPESPKLIELEGNMVFRIRKDNTFSLGRTCNKSGCDITRSDIIIDGSRAMITVFVEENLSFDFSVFRIMREASNVTLRNLNIKVFVKYKESVNDKLFSIYNYGEGTRLENINIYMKSEAQVNMRGIANFADKADRWSAKGDNLLITDSKINIDCLPENFPKKCEICGIHNENADSISVQNCYVKTVIEGCGQEQIAMGIYTSGKFGRFVGNNVKASGRHPKARLREKAHAIGFVNKGEYSLISSNNIVGERGGFCAGLDNYGKFTRIGGNKILATHAISGSTVRNRANDTVIDSNVITSTCRHAKLIEHIASDSIITGNYMRVLLNRPQEITGCGIYAVGDKVRNNIISGNYIRQILNCGIFAEEKCGVIDTTNIVFSYNGNITKTTPTEHPEFIELFDEDKIKSLIDE